MNRSIPTTATLTQLVLCAFATGNASAACYSMYDAGNRLVYESSVSPIDLSHPVSQQMAARYPARALIISLTTTCSDTTASPNVGNRYTSETVSGDAFGSTLGQRPRP